MLNFISTPIGNLNDISLRAIDVIRTADYLYAEDTRNVKKLLNFINCKKKCKSFHEHNEVKEELSEFEKRLAIDYQLQRAIDLIRGVSLYRETLE